MIRRSFLRGPRRLRPTGLRPASLRPTGPPRRRSGLFAAPAAVALLVAPVLPAAASGLSTLPATPPESPGPRPPALFASAAETGERWYEPTSGLRMLSLGRPSPGAPQTPGETPPRLYFAASGEFSFATARVTVDARMTEGAALTVRLTRPSGTTETLSTERNGTGPIARHTWTGSLPEAGDYRVEAVLEGGGRDRWSAAETLSLRAGEPSCAVSLAVPEGPTEWWLQEITANVCESAAATGELATAYVTVTRDGEQIASMDMSQACERSFFIPWGGEYEADAVVHDDRGVNATCSSNDVGVEESHPRAWVTTDFAGGVTRSSRPDVQDPPNTSPLAGAGLGLTIPFRPASDTTVALTARVAGGRAHRNWLGVAADAALTVQGRPGFLGLGAGAWGIGDPDAVDLGLFGTGGINLPARTWAGPVQAFFEARLFAKQLDDWQNNYAVLGGLRFNFEPHHRLRRR